MESITNQLAVIVKDLFDVDVVPVLGRPDEQFGDYSTNVAMQLARQLNKNPREVAEAITDKLRDTKLVKEVSVAGPGFINIQLSDESLLALIHLNPAQLHGGKSIVAEYSDPNPFKVLHAGHLYTSIVGDAIANLLEMAGGNVHRVNFGGDVGLHVAKTMWAIVRELGGEHPDKLATVVFDPEDPEWRAGWLSKRYVEGNSAYEDDESAKVTIIDYNKRIYETHTNNDHDSEFAQIYWTCRQWSYDYFEYFYNTIGVKPFEKYYPESETADIGRNKVDELLGRGILEESDGAVVFKGEPHGLHTRVFLTREGLPTYEAKDLGLIIAKNNDYHFDSSIVITGNDIVEYMKVILKVVEQFAPELSTTTRHLTHGLVKLEGGKKMSSRKGNTLGALDIIMHASNAAREANEISDTVLLKQITFGAVKYAFLKQRIGGDIIYDPEESVAQHGNSGPYIQYAHARARSILLKAGASGSLIDGGELTQGERSLVRKLGEYAEVVELSTIELMPHYVCTYLYELSQVFNGFYENERVIGDDRQDFRLGLVDTYANTLKKGLEILGISAPEHM